MDKVIVTGLLVIAGVITAVILLGALRTGVEDASQATRTTGEQADAQLKSEVTILQVLSNGTGDRLDIWVKNTGRNQIRPLERIDVFLIDVEGNWGDYMTYSPGGLVGNQNTWRVLSPLRLEWNPGDTFHIQASLPLNPLLNNVGYNLSITTPDLYTAKYRFDPSP